MKYLNIFLLLVLLVCSNKAIAGSTQTNVSGSNTAIEGNYYIFQNAMGKIKKIIWI